MKKSPYIDDFSSWKDIQEQYDTQEPEPDEVVLAGYSYENYEGYSVVIYRNREKYYYVEGSHCSCNGLEGQWSPEEFPDKKTILKYLKNSYLYKKYENEINQGFNIFDNEEE